MQFNFKKKYGQNFLKHESTIKKIIECVNVKDEDLIIEIGPGSGALTKYLCNYSCPVICYEIDEDLKPYLSNYENDNLHIIYDDFLKHDIKNDISKFEYKNLKIIGNLPYYITTPIILYIIENVIPDEMIFMVQKEVADRLSSNPGNREYGSITVLLNYYFDIKREFVVKRDEFIPSPNVDSAIIKFTKKDNLPDIDIKKFNKLVKDAFQFKRKNLRNNLKKYDLNKISEVLAKYNFTLDNRAEDLSVSVFIDITKNI